MKIDNNKVREFVDYIGRTYNTYGITRTFKGSNGHNISVSGGDYGWLLNREQETIDLIKLVKKGKKLIESQYILKLLHLIITQTGVIPM